MRVALDTNVLVYAEGVGDDRRCAQAKAVIIEIAGVDLFIATQTLLELYNVLTRKAGLSRNEVVERVAFWQTAGNVVPTGHALLADAMALSARHHVQIWDAVILAAAASQACAVLLSENMHNGFVWHGTTVVNPFNLATH